MWYNYENYCMEKGMKDRKINNELLEKNVNGDNNLKSIYNEVVPDEVIEPVLKSVREKLLKK